MRSAGGSRASARSHPGRPRGAGRAASGPRRLRSARGLTRSLRAVSQRYLHAGPAAKGVLDSQLRRGKVLDRQTERAEQRDLISIAATRVHAGDDLSKLGADVIRTVDCGFAQGELILAGLVEQRLAAV